MTNELSIKTKDYDTRDLLLTKIGQHGRVSDWWPGGSFTFQCNDEDAVAKVVEIAKGMSVETELI